MGGEGYPTGNDIASEKQAMTEPVENPVIAGFRAIIMLITKLEQNQDPRAQMAKEHLAGLLQTLQGAPQESPMPAPEAGPPPVPGGAAEGMPMDAMPVGGGAPPMDGPAPMGPPPAGAPPMPGGPVPEPAPAPAGVSPMGMNAGAKGKSTPMTKKPNQGKQPVILT